MVSIRTPSCSSPRPATSKASGCAVSLTRMATLPSASANSRARISRDVSLVPERPASGESLTAKIMASVGGSTGWAGSAASTAGSHSVSATLASPKPAMATMSPARASSIGWRSSPRKARSLVTRVRSTTAPSRSSAFTPMLWRTVPDRMRPVSTRPT